MIMPKSKLLEELILTHETFTARMSSFFGLPPNSVKPILVRFHIDGEQLAGAGVFEKSVPEIAINPFFYESFKENIFTIAHESAHYLHFLQRPEFYDLPNHPKLKNNRKKNGNLNSAGWNFLWLVRDFRELVPDIAAFEFFRVQKLLPEYLSENKRVVLKYWERIAGMGDYNQGSFFTLTQYYIYQKLFRENKLTETMNIKHDDIESFRKFSELSEKAKEHLGSTPWRIRKLYALPPPQEQTLFG